MSGFILDDKLILETTKTDDLLDFSNEISAMDEMIDEINNPSVIGLIGKFGSGKSTMLYQLRKKRKGVWVEFDSWQYPERKNLWEGLILELASKINKRDITTKKIDGTQSKDNKKIIDVSSKIPYLISNLRLIAPFIEATIKDIKYFFNDSPIKRVYELQILLKEILEKIDGDIYIVVEDIDRSQDAGIFFLETLKQFLRNLEIDKKIVVFVPIGSSIFNGKREEYSKCLDYVEDFYPNNGLNNFVNTVVRDMEIDGIEHNKAVLQVSSFLEELINQYSDQITMREIKRIFRQANKQFIAMKKKSFNPDWRVVIIVESMRLVFNDKSEPFFREFKNKERVNSATIWSRALYMISLKKENINNTNLIGRVPSWEIIANLGENNLFLPTVYIQPFGDMVWAKISDKYFQE